VLRHFLLWFAEQQSKISRIAASSPALAILINFAVIASKSSTVSRVSSRARNFSSQPLKGLPLPNLLLFRKRHGAS
jgi:hypothetical protein